MKQSNSMNNIGNQLGAIERNIEINSNDPIAKGGFTQVPNFILENPDINIGAKLTYAMFLKYAWEKDCAFPGQEKLAAHMGISSSRVSEYVKELKELGLVEITRRGLGKTNLYKLNFTVRKKRGNMAVKVQTSTYRSLDSGISKS